MVLAAFMFFVVFGLMTAFCATAVAGWGDPEDRIHILTWSAFALLSFACAITLKLQ